VSQEAAENFAENVISQPTPEYKTLADLDAGVRSRFFDWLKWFGMQTRPAGLPDWVSFSPTQVASKLSFEIGYLRSLIAQRDAVIAEVRAHGEDAFKAHPKVTSVVLDVPAAGDMTITGTELASIAGGAGGVEATRPGGGTVQRTVAQITAAGGSVAATEIVVRSGTFPLVVQAGDQIRVAADGIFSEVWVIQ